MPKQVITKPQNIIDVPEPQVLPVLFRRYRDGEVLAVFPTLTGDYGGVTCTSYAHIGQHSGCNYHAAVLPMTRVAKPDEYADLKAELEEIGYTLKVVRKVTERMDRARSEEARLLREEG